MAKMHNSKTSTRTMAETAKSPYGDSRARNNPRAVHPNSTTPPLPHQVSGSRIQMMLNRSRRATVPEVEDIADSSIGDTSISETGPDDLNEYNFESSNNIDLNRQIQIALEEQAELEDNLVSPQASVHIDSSNNSSSSSNDNTTHLSGRRLQIFNQIAGRAHLDEQNDQFIACMVAVLATLQDVSSIRDEILGAIRTNPHTRGVSTTPDVVTWKADSAELKQCMRLLATQSILGGGVQAYTARVDPLGGTDQLPLGLYSRVMSALLSNPSEWKNRVLPPGYGSNPDPRHTRALETTLNNVLKEVRKSFDDVLLTHINLPNRVNSGGHANVPVLDTVIVKVRRGQTFVRCRVRITSMYYVALSERMRNDWRTGSSARRDPAGGRSIANLTLRMADFLSARQRMQAIHWGMNFADYGGRSFWNVVDRQLAHLRTQSTRYRYVFFILILQSDLERIDGTKTFDKMKETTDFSLPTEAQINHTMNKLNQTFGATVQPDEEAHAIVTDEAE
ncbi:uncharacterized protein MELLADRAFT_94293 [Melampsora larici-populina 98AG31]|uniref:Uncharacterized protein n=1 Tax=Melampsora larici-populina (strain 98AG31 / pathotype 3-4-7) TaxID=747676 RepID=F4S773_MELLP|nr:uncharacterized protein MELLADRAFT_94293 [Melampsora larici-populina 98AG31]EGF99462.1 hypothetical protein MELLADRAFT_94293 [Melampsora larici-populina 98AG31]